MSQERHSWVTEALSVEPADRIPEVHVAFFWRRPGEALPIVGRLLAPGGALYLFNQTPGWSDHGARGFGERVAPAPTVYVKAQPA